MTKYNKEVSEIMGLDLGDRYSQFCLVNRQGEVMERGRVATTATAMRKEFGGRAAARMALEAGTHSPWVSRLLAELGHEVLVANPRKLRMIYQSDSKNDRADAETLARVARLDTKLLGPIRHRTQEAQVDLAIIRSRDALIKARTQLINHVRGVMKSVGSRLPKSSSPSFHKKATAGLIPALLESALAPILETLETISEQIKNYDRRIEQLSREKYPETELLTPVSGIGNLTALTYVLTLEDPERFSQSRAVGSFLGLRPRQADSGKQEPQLRITKAGDPLLRRLLVNSAQYLLGHFGQDCDLRRWGLELAKRGGKSAKKRAAVAVARKLAVLLHRLWNRAEVYDPFYQSRSQSPEAVLVS
jgi:transposase